LIIHFYTRRGCHLCEIMLEEVLPLVRGRAEIQTRDVDSDPEWHRKYDIRVPVLEINGELVSEYPLDVEALKRRLAEIPENNAEIGILRR
tara:strand:+ start:15245 stop:15514 length:270 start_codon:yes stop_codon:yes gene_type:complete